MLGVPCVWVTVCMATDLLAVTLRHCDAATGMWIGMHLHPQDGLGPIWMHRPQDASVKRSEPDVRLSFGMHGMRSHWHFGIPRMRPPHFWPHPCATGALKLVGEGFPWTRDSRFAYTRDNHNSVLGIREQARTPTSCSRHLASCRSLLRAEITIVHAHCSRTLGRGDVHVSCVALHRC